MLHHHSFWPTRETELSWIVMDLIADFNINNNEPLVLYSIFDLAPYRCLANGTDVRITAVEDCSNTS